MFQLPDDIKRVWRHGFVVFVVNVDGSREDEHHHSEDDTDVSGNNVMDLHSGSTLSR